MLFDANANKVIIVPDAELPTPNQGETSGSGTLETDYKPKASSAFRYQLVVYAGGDTTGRPTNIGPSFESSALCDKYADALTKFFEEKGLSFIGWTNPTRRK